MALCEKIACARKKKIEGQHSNLFSSMLPSLFTRNETFCKHKDSLKVFGTVRFTGDLQLKMFSKNDEFFPIFCFFEKMFSVEKDGCFMFPVKEEWFSRSMRIPLGNFWHCIIDEILTNSFYSWFSV